MDVYSLLDKVPLSFNRVRANAVVTGLTVTVVVKNAQTGATLLASTSVPEQGGATGIYTYLWTHGLTDQTECIATYTVGSSIYTEFFLVDGNFGGRAA